ncbi:MAG TPA: mannosyltransferase family protein, partial [Acidimicrobiales bacterium]
AVATYVAVHLVTLAFVIVDERVRHAGLVNHLSIWDGEWFLRAVANGWPSHLPMVDGHVSANTTAFFPVFPLVLRVLAAITGLSAAVVGLWVSALTGLSALIAIGHLAREFTDQATAERAALLFAVAPGAFIFNLIYAEGILLTCVAVGLLALLRKRWVVAGLLGAVASATSPVGIVFVATCALTVALALVREREWRSLWALALSPVGFAAWMAYLWVHTGTLMAWRLTERGGWQSYPSLAYPVHILTKFLFNPISPTMTGQILFAGTVVSILGVVVIVKEHQPAPVLAYGIFSVVFFAVAAPVGLRPRFVMLAFPLVIGAATRWNGRRFRLILLVSLTLLLLMTVEEMISFAVFP